ncbi:MAG: hypothetical protein CUN53_01710 [Phototrophicales bacterium]|nr:MAG: hypothetical protein CUN53_01710 [Phototrophicales bacterium]
MLDLELMAQQQRHEELVKRAREDRMAQELLADERGYIPSLAWVGERIVKIGKSLITLSGRESNRISHN